MARTAPRAAELGLIAVSIEGGLIAPEQVQKILATDRSDQAAQSYACPKGTMLADEISRYFRIGQAIWREYDRVDAKTATRTAAFARDLLTQCFGFADLTGPIDHHQNTRRFRLAWEAKQGRVPIVVAAPIAGADAFAKAQPEFGDGEGGRTRRSPTALLQDWLNAADHALWGMVFAGDRLRLMRDNASLTRPAWIEADLGRIFAEEAPYTDFIAIWLLAHATRFGGADAPPSACPLEQWREAGLKQGIEARADLRRNVETALGELVHGLAEANPDLVQRLQSGALALDSLFAELLRTIYRLIFLAVAEDRDLLHPRRVAQSVRALYEGSYSFTFWRERSRRRVARDAHHDVWEAVKITLSALDQGQDLLGLPALGGLFAASATPTLNAAKIPNARFLAAIYSLGFIRRDGVTHRINWRDLKTEELGSVYEGLLEIRLQPGADGSFTLDSGAKGNDRKTSGSYYTPDSLVECLLDSALDPVLDKAEAQGATAADKVAAILDLNVIDPACGSGHFLLGAARHMATRIARLRNEDAGKDDFQAALRDVVARCIHGVDRNPMAVELAKVALWIESVSPGAPLGFLDGNIRCGDSLLGVFDLAALDEGIPDEAYKPLTGDSKDAAKYYLKLNRDAKLGQGQLNFAGGGGAMPPRRMAAGLGTIKAMPEDTVGQVEKKRAAFEAWKADPARWNVAVACDLYMAAFLLPKAEVPDARGRAMVPTTAEVRRKLAGGSVYGPLEAAGVDAARFASVLHWPLEFPDVIVANGGFDVVLGNPPWERIKLQEQEFFAGHPVADEPNAAARRSAIAKLAEASEGSPDRRLYEAFEIAKRIAEASSAFARVPEEGGGRYPYTGTGDVNTYALFAEHFLNLTQKDGRAGLIVPTGIVTDYTTSRFFAHLVSSNRLVASLGFDNARRIFPSIHPDTPFTLLTTGFTTAPPQFTSYILSTDELEDRRRHYSLSPHEIARINPNTKTAPVFRASEDARLTAAVYGRAVVVDDIGDPTNKASLKVKRFYDMNRKEVLAIATREAVSGFLPVMEGKLFFQFDHRHSSYRRDGAGPDLLGVESKSDFDYEVLPRYWIPEKDVRTRLEDAGWQQQWIMGLRDLTNATNERTVIAAAMPLSATDYTVRTLIADDFFEAVTFVACANCLVFDFVARGKIGGMHLAEFIFQQLPILPPSAYDEAALAFIVPRVLELTYTSHSMAPFARDLGYGGPPFAWNDDRRAHLRAELDAWYALAYGLTRDELRYVLDPKDVMGPDYPSETFRVLQNNERTKYGEYRTQRLVLSAYDELTAQGMRPRLEGYR